MRSKNKLYLLMLCGFALISIGCGKYKSNGSATPDPGLVTPVPTDNPVGVVPGTPGHTDTVDPTEGVWTSGGTATFVPVNNTVFNMWMTGYHVDPQNLLINVDLKKVSTTPFYAGAVKIRYNDNGVTYEATLKAGTNIYDGKYYAMYNYWFNYQGQKVFSGFFEDKVGAIVLVVDQYLDLGDGGGASEIGGEIWFKNFTASWADYDEGAAWAAAVLPCWFRTIGPYDCRNGAVMNKTGLYPNNGYIKLGEFSNMNKLKAFSN